METQKDIGFHMFCTLTPWILLQMSDSLVFPSVSVRPNFRKDMGICKNQPLSFKNIAHWQERPGSVHYHCGNA